MTTHDQIAVFPVFCAPSSLARPWLWVAVIACLAAAPLWADEEKAEEEKELTPAEEFQALKVEYGDSSKTGTSQKKLRLIREARRMPEAPRFPKGEAGAALRKAIAAWVVVELPKVGREHYGQLLWDEDGMVVKCRLMRELHELLADEEMMAASADAAALKIDITAWVGTEVGTAFEQLGRRFRELERNRDYMPERERGEIMRALGECPLAAHPRGEKFAEAVGGFLVSVLAEDSSERVKVRAMGSIARLSRENWTQVLWKFAEGHYKKDSLYLERIPEAMAGTTDDESGAWVVKKKLLAASPETRSLAAEAVGNMRYAGAVEALVKLLKDKDVGVRYESILALGKIGAKETVPAILEKFADPDPRIRDAAAMAIADLKAEEALDTLYNLLHGDTEPIVRESVVLAIRSIANRDSVDSLIGRISAEPMARIKEQIAETIRQLTGSDMTTYDTDIWRSWWEVAKHRKEGEKNVEENISEGHRSVVKYYELEVLSNRVVFILDVSCSMEWGNRIRTVKDEFYKTLDQLNPDTQFDIVRFASDFRGWAREVVKKEKGRAKDVLIDASPEHKAMAKEWVEKLLPGGGTNTFETIEFAFQSYPDADTFYFLSDGAPSLGRHKLQEKILAEFKKMNRYRKVQIHCIAVLVGEPKEDWGETALIFDDKEVCIDFMRRLAAENRGNFVLRADPEDDEFLTEEELERRDGKAKRKKSEFEIDDDFGIDDLSGKDGEKKEGEDKEAEKKEAEKKEAEKKEGSGAGEGDGDEFELKDVEDAGEETPAGEDEDEKKPEDDDKDGDAGGGN